MVTTTLKWSRKGRQTLLDDGAADQGHSAVLGASGISVLHAGGHGPSETEKSSVFFQEVLVSLYTMDGFIQRIGVQGVLGLDWDFRHGGTVLS
jgi:hypothetical protein